MCNNISVALIFLITISTSCVGQKSDNESGILKGVIGIYEGNCMPGPGIPPCEPRPISTTVLITELSESFLEEKLISKIKSNDDGVYKMSLPPGNYSLFLMDEEKVVCTLIHCPDKCLCQPFTIVADSTTIVDANLDHAQW
ncbi:hypothetical protein [Ekhidna sp.]|uniref:hypothetical protein n=1 Tax=Ekhidna sp. TaxID=2608089 RepID=UPI00329A3929